MSGRLLLVIIVIISIVIIIYMLSQAPDKTTTYNEDFIYSPNNSYHQVKTKSEPVKKPQRSKKGLQLNLHEVRRIYDMCPCDEGYICEDGLCKSGPTGPCMFSSDCMSSELCISGYCTSPPKTWEEIACTDYDGEQILVNGHAMMLYNNKLLLPTSWWSIANVVSVIQAEDSGFYYILSSSGEVYRALADRIIRDVHPIDIYDRHASFTPQKLVNFGGSILMLATVDFISHLYQVKAIQTTSGYTWKLVHIEKLGEHFLENGIVDIQIALNNDLVITYERQNYYTSFIYHYEDQKWEQDNFNNMRIFLGNSYHNRIEYTVTENNQKQWYFYPGTISPQIRVDLNESTAKRKIVSALIDPDNCHSVIIVDTEGNCVRITFPHLAREKLKSKIRLKSKQIVLSKNIAEGLLRTNTNIFMVTGQHLLDI